MRLLIKIICAIFLIIILSLSDVSATEEGRGLRIGNNQQMSSGQFTNIKNSANSGGVYDVEVNPNLELNQKFEAKDESKILTLPTADRPSNTQAPNSGPKNVNHRNVAPMGVLDLDLVFTPGLINEWRKEENTIEIPWYKGSSVWGRYYAWDLKKRRISGLCKVKHLTVEELINDYEFNEMIGLISVSSDDQKPFSPMVWNSAADIAMKKGATELIVIKDSAELNARVKGGSFGIFGVIGKLMGAGTSGIATPGGQYTSGKGITSAEVFGWFISVSGLRLKPGPNMAKPAPKPADTVDISKDLNRIGSTLASCQSLSPFNEAANILNGRAHVYKYLYKGSNQSDLVTARLAFEQALRNNPRNKNARFWLAFVQNKLGWGDKAARNLAKSGRQGYTWSSVEQMVRAQMAKSDNEFPGWVDAELVKISGLSKTSAKKRSIKKLKTYSEQRELKDLLEDN